MNNLFLFLFFISFISIFVALIRPSTFKKIFKENTNRKFLSIFFIISTIVFFILFWITAGSLENTNQPTEKIPTEEIPDEEIPDEEIPDEVFNLSSVLGKNYNQIIDIAWEPKKYYDYYDTNPSQWLSNSAYWYFNDHYFSAEFNSKNESIERFFVSSENLNLTLKDYEELFWLNRISNLGYIFTRQAMMQDPTKITWVHVKK